MHDPAPSPQWRRRLVAVLAVAASTMGVGAATAPSASAYEIGTQDDSVFLHQHYGNRVHALNMMKRIGVRHLRVNVIWSEFKRYERQFRRHRAGGWKPYDDIVNLARSMGVRVQFTIIATPDYDRRGDRYIWYRNTNARRFGAFARRIARRYRGKVRRHACGNEPNLGRFLSPQRRAVPLYRALYKACYRAIKGADRRNEVLIGETTSSKNPLGFLAAVANTRGGLRSDGFAHHGFQFFIRPGRPDRRYIGISNIPKIKATLRTLARRRLLRRSRGNSAIPILFTEYAYQRRGIYRIPESRRRQWALESFIFARRQRIKQMVWYQVSHQPIIFSRGDAWDSGMIDLAGRGDSVYNHLYRNRRRFGVR
jgi:hypothetical protein